MRRLTLFLVLLIVLASLSACAANRDQKALTMTSTTTAKESIAKQTDGIPLLLLFEKHNKARTAVIKQENLLCYWDIKTGKMSFEKTAVPNETITSDRNYKMFARNYYAVKNKDNTLHVYGKAPDFRNAAPYFLEMMS